MNPQIFCEIIVRISQCHLQNTLSIRCQLIVDRGPRAHRMNINLKWFSFAYTIFATIDSIAAHRCAIYSGYSCWDNCYLWFSFKFKTLCLQCVESQSCLTIKMGISSLDWNVRAFKCLWWLIDLKMFRPFWFMYDKYQFA